MCVCVRERGICRTCTHLSDLKRSESELVRELLMRTKYSSAVIFLLTIASRIPSPHSLASLSVAMTARSRWTVSVLMQPDPTHSMIHILVIKSKKWINCPDSSVSGMHLPKAHQRPSLEPLFIFPCALNESIN